MNSDGLIQDRFVAMRLNDANFFCHIEVIKNTMRNFVKLKIIFIFAYYN